MVLAQTDATDAATNSQHDEEVFESALGFVNRTTRLFAIVSLFWTGFYLFGGSGFWLEIGLLLHLMLRYGGKFLNQTVSRLTGVDLTSRVQERPGWLPATVDVGQGAKTWRARFSLVLYRLFTTPFDAFIAKLTSVLDGGSRKFGSIYQPAAALPMLTLQGLITLSAAVMLIVAFTPGFLLTDRIIDTWLCICLVTMFLHPIIHSRTFVRTFFFARARPWPAAALAVLTYLAALLLVAFRFQPDTMQIWQAQSLWEWMEGLGRVLAPSTLSEWREMMAKLWANGYWADLQGYTALIPEVFAALLSIGAIKVAGTVIFEKPDDESHRARGMMLLSSGRTQKARDAFRKMQAKDRRTELMMLPAMIDGDETEFRHWLKAHCEETFATYWAAQPGMLTYHCLAVLDNTFHLDWSRYPLAEKILNDDVHPALDLGRFTPMGGMTEDSIFKKLNLLFAMGYGQQQRDLASSHNPTRFPAGLFVEKDGELVPSFQLDRLGYILTSNPDDPVPVLDQLGAVVIGASLLQCPDIGELISAEDQRAMTHEVRACAERIQGYALPLGREMEEFCIRMAFQWLPDALCPQTKPYAEGGSVRQVLDQLLVRNMARSRQEGLTSHQ